MDYLIDLLLYYKLLNTLMLVLGFALYVLLKYMYDIQKIKEPGHDSIFCPGIWVKNNWIDLLVAFIMTIVVYVILYLRGGIDPETAAVVGVAGTHIFSTLYKTIILRFANTKPK